MSNQFGIGQSVSRAEDPRLLKGQGLFVDDIRLPGTALRATSCARRTRMRG